jgi:hypothetical protein
MRIGFLNDVHCGSAFAPWPESGQLSVGGKHVPNIGQKYLNDHWYETAKEIPDLDILVFDGDVIDGDQWKSLGRHTVEVDHQYQSRAALELLDPFLNKSRVRYVCEGTEYHDGKAGMWAEWLAREVGAVPKDQHICWDWLLLEIDGLKCDIAHAQSYMMRYRSTALEREMQFSCMLGENADLIARAHVHNYGMVQMPKPGGLQTAISLPAWQFDCHYIRTGKTPNRSIELMMGCVIVEILPRKRLLVNPGYLFEHPPLRRSVYVTA